MAAPADAAAGRRIVVIVSALTTVGRTLADIGGFRPEAGRESGGLPLLCQGVEQRLRFDELEGSAHRGWPPAGQANEPDK